MHLKTNYAIGDLPHSEHPLPQAMRENWLCLNGTWQLKKLNSAKQKVFESEILVPFSPETLNSGVIGEDGKEGSFTLNTGETLVYERKAIVEENLMLGRTLLHFAPPSTARL